jgi:hypothetical protein
MYNIGGEFLAGDRREEQIKRTSLYQA